jgi:hypothetical protein
MELGVQELEAAINYWRERAPARGNEYALSPEVNVLATIYARMIFRGAPALDANALEPRAQHLLHVWRTQQST